MQSSEGHGKAFAFFRVEWGIIFIIKVSLKSSTYGVPFIEITFLSMSYYFYFGNLFHRVGRSSYSWGKDSDT